MPRPPLIGPSHRAHEVDVESTVLELLAQHPSPLGASVLHKSLAERGIACSQATAGRLLQHLDRDGLTQQQGRRGRNLTSKGFRHLEALRRLQDRQEHGRRFLRSIDTESPLILLDVLIGRRAVERETARLAAMRATDDELRTLQSLYDQHVRQKATGSDAVLENREFHLFIARIAKSRVLETALELILAESSVSQVLIRMRRKAGSRSGSEHPRIVLAILDRDARAAEAAMMQHIDHIIRDLYRFHGGELPAIEQTTNEPAIPYPEAAATI